MKEERIFIWMAQSMRRTQFISWVKEQHEVGVSHATLRRAMERQYTGVDLTERQKGIKTLAETFRNTISA